MGIKAVWSAIRQSYWLWIAIGSFFAYGIAVWRAEMVDWRSKIDAEASVLADIEMSDVSVRCLWSDWNPGGSARCAHAIYASPQESSKVYAYAQRVLEYRAEVREFDSFYCQPELRNPEGDLVHYAQWVLAPLHFVMNPVYWFVGIKSCRAHERDNSNAVMLADDYGVWGHVLTASYGIKVSSDAFQFGLTDLDMDRSVRNERSAMALAALSEQSRNSPSAPGAPSPSLAITP